MTRELLEKIANKIIFNIREQLERNDSISSNNLSNDITPIITDNSVKIEMLDYAIYLDEGTGPRDKMPPIDPIKKWVNNKGININPWAIAKNIQMYGTKAHPFLYIIDTLEYQQYFDEYFESIEEKLDEGLKLDGKVKKITIKI